MTVIKSTPHKRVAKAGRKVDRALSVFVDAAATLDQAAGEHLAVRDELVALAGVVESSARVEYGDAVGVADAAHLEAIKAAGATLDVRRGKAADHRAHAANLAAAAADAQSQAASIRALLSAR